MGGKIQIEVQMFRKTVFIGRKGRIWVGLVLLVGLVVMALSPALLGVGMMALEEARTGVPQHEGNNVWGVLPWLTMFTAAICIPAAGIALLLMVIGVVHDLVAILLKRNAGESAGFTEGPGEPNPGNWGEDVQWGDDRANGDEHA